MNRAEARMRAISGRSDSASVGTGASRSVAARSRSAATSHSRRGRERGERGERCLLPGAIASLDAAIERCELRPLERVRERDRVELGGPCSRQQQQAMRAVPRLRRERLLRDLDELAHPRIHARRRRCVRMGENNVVGHHEPLGRHKIAELDDGLQSRETRRAYLTIS